MSCLHSPGCLVEADKQVLREGLSPWQQPLYLAALAALQSTSITCVLDALQTLSCHKTAHLQSKCLSATGCGMVKMQEVLSDMPLAKGQKDLSDMLHCTCQCVYAEARHTWLR